MLPNLCFNPLKLNRPLSGEPCKVNGKILVISLTRKIVHVGRILYVGHHMSIYMMKPTIDSIAGSYLTTLSLARPDFGLLATRLRILRILEQRFHHFKFSTDLEELGSQPLDYNMVSIPRRNG